MLKRKDNETDIAKQGYKGPSATVAAAGESLLRGKILLLSGAVFGAIAGAVFPSHSARIIETCHNSVSKLHNSNNYLIRGIGGFSKWSLEMGEHLVNWVKGVPAFKDQLVKLENNDPAKRFVTATNGAVLMSAITSLLGFFSGTGAGASRARAGRKQVKDLQSEVLNLREDTNDLREKLVNTQSELEEEKAAHAHKKSHHHDDAEEHHHHKNGRWADSIAAEKAAQENAELSL